MTSQARPVVTVIRASSLGAKPLLPVPKSRPVTLLGRGNRTASSGIAPNAAIAPFVYGAPAV